MRVFLVALLLFGGANAAVVQVDSHDQGRIYSNYFAYEGAPLYFYDDIAIGGSQIASGFPAGSSGSHYQVFDLSGIEGTVDSAVFSIYLGAGGYSFYSVPGEEGEIRGCCTQDNFYRIFPVQYIDEILSVRDGEADLWTDYGEPVWFEIQALVDDMYAGYYAEFALREEDEGSWIDMSLNAAGIADINAALGNSFGVAGNNPVVYCTNSIGIDEGGCVDRMFESPDSGFGKLTLTGSISVVPIPAAVWLFGSGLAALAGLRRWRAADTRL